jgi:ethanolamine ammonia-lyase small subunit
MTLPTAPCLVAASAPEADPWVELRRHTPARIALGRSGSGLPTAEALRFAADHAQARDAVHVPLDAAAMCARLQAGGFATLQVSSRAGTRAEFLRRPDLGRRLAPACVQALLARAQALGQALPQPPFDLAVVLGDGLSALAVHGHGLPLIRALQDALAGALRWAPVVVATQARVALADEIGALLGARTVLMLIGERPGLSSPDSLGAYLTYAPEVGRVDAQRNCVSNIRPAGLPPVAAAQRIAWLLHQSLRLRLSGVALKDESGAHLLGP